MSHSPLLTCCLDKDRLHGEGEDGLSQGLEKVAEHTTDDVDIRHLVQTRVAFSLQNALLHLLDGLAGTEGETEPIPTVCTALLSLYPL